VKELFGSAADSAAVRAAESVPLCFRWRLLCSGELQALPGGEGRSMPSFQFVSYLMGEPGSLSAFLKPNLNPNPNPKPMPNPNLSLCP